MWADSGYGDKLIWYACITFWWILEITERTFCLDEIIIVD